MPYKPVEDIANIDDIRVNFKVINPQMLNLINSVRVALKSTYNFKKKTDYRDELAAFLKTQLLVYSSTHNSIHILTRHSLRKKDSNSITDAASLTREQVEKIYSIALVLHNPHKWIKQDLRASWRGAYQTYLLDQEEHANSPRFNEFLTQHYPKYLKQAQRPPSALRKIKPEVIVSEYARKALTHYWNNPIGRNPVWFNKKLAIRNYITEYFEFPTPGKSIKYITGKEKKRFLFRWHKEYSYFSGFAHAGFEKTVIPFMNESRNLRTAEKVDIISQTLTMRNIFTSYIAIASACTLIIPELKSDYGSKRQLIEFWQVLNSSSLLSRALWKIYVENRLK